MNTAEMILTDQVTDRPRNFHLKPPSAWPRNVRVDTEPLDIPMAVTEVGNEANRKFVPIHFHLVVKTTSTAALENRPLVNSEGVSGAA